MIFKTPKFLLLQFEKLLPTKFLKWLVVTPWLQLPKFHGKRLDGAQVRVNLCARCAGSAICTNLCSTNRLMFSCDNGCHPYIAL